MSEARRGTHLSAVPPRQFSPRLRSRLVSLHAIEKAKGTYQLTLVHHGRDDVLGTAQHLFEKLIPSELPILERDSGHDAMYKGVGKDPARGPLDERG